MTAEYRLSRLGSSATTNTSTRLRCSSHETAMTATRTHATHMTHHHTGEQSTSSNGSNGQGHRQAPQLQTANEQLKIQKSMEPVSSQQIWLTGKWHRRAHQKPHQHYWVHLPTQETDRPQKDAQMGNWYAWSDPKRQNPTKCDSR